jgi:hypothetical protein
MIELDMYKNTCTSEKKTPSSANGTASSSAVMNVHLTGGIPESEADPKTIS